MSSMQHAAQGSTCRCFSWGQGACHTAAEVRPAGPGCLRAAAAAAARAGASCNERAMEYLLSSAALSVSQSYRALCCCKGLMDAQLSGTAMLPSSCQVVAACIFTWAARGGQQLVHQA